MKLLLDQNISRRILPNLEPHFSGSTQVALVGLDHATDLEIWEYARVNNYVIVTKDSDFEEFSILNGSPPKVIWLKIGNASNAAIQQILVEHSIHIEAALNDPAVHCIELF